MGDHKTTSLYSLCQFECTVGKCKCITGFVEFLQNVRWPPNCITYIAPNTPVHGDHQTTSPCEFECAIGKHKQVMGFIELPQNPRWPPNHVTYIVSDILVHGGPPDHFTM